MKRVTILSALLALFALPVLGQGQHTIEYELNVPLSEDFFSPFTQGDENGAGVHSGARTVAGPYDLDGDGQLEVLVSDYAGGGRVHVIENTGPDTWELAYSTPAVDSTSTTENIRTITGGDLDGDGNGEIIFLAGREYSETNPNIDDLPPGLYVYEFNGTDFGDLPTSIYEFDDLPNRWRAEQMTTQDIDGDGIQELMFGNNGSNPYDNWYIISVTGNIGSGFEVFTQEVRLSSRASEEFDPVDRGGGSPYAIHPADLDGDGTYELSLHSWNAFNLTTGDVLDEDTYQFPEDTAPNPFLQASSGVGDHVSFFGGVVMDINGDGDDEVFYPNLFTGNITVINYEAGEDVLQTTPDNVAFDVIPGVSALGIAAGDLDADENAELYGSGSSYSADSKAADELPTWVRVAEYIGGDVEDGANYQVSALDFYTAADTAATNFDYVMRDSAGVMTEYFEDTNFTGKDRAGRHPGQGAVFVSKMAYLGDVDGDGTSELAVAYQGVDDSTYVFQETFNPEDSTYTRVVLEARPVENRVFLRIVSAGNAPVAVEDPQGDLPQGFRLSANYPNPFNPATSFTFTLPADQVVSVKVYDAMGRLVKTIIDGQHYTQGRHQATWNGTMSNGATAASGTYFYTLEVDGQRLARPMVLVK
jgi:hypothetical protein